MNETSHKDSQTKTARPPIVVVMGHIDHGKSQILETIRNTKMLEKEAGGITQHIGAYHISHNGKGITFIDTPGHEAFTAMRSRGATVADIAILVVAADEGVKPQTKEAIRVIQEQHMPFVVALNKMDKPEANAERVKQELAQEEILVESYGGKVPSVEISAQTGKNIEDLLEVILLVSDLEELRAEPAAPAEGVVIEAHVDTRRGRTATLLIQNGTLHAGDTIILNATTGPVRILEDSQSQAIKEAGPSQPVVAAGLPALPAVGEVFFAFENKKQAETFIKNQNLTARATAPVATDVHTEATEEKITFNVILKADVAGSLEVLSDMLGAIQSDIYAISILKSDVGDINESDVKFALAARPATIAGFKVKVDASTKDLAENNNITIITSDIIYELIDTVKEGLAELLPPEIHRTDLGKIKVLKTFKKNEKEQVVGGRVEEGMIKTGARVDIVRDKELLGAVTVLGLKREKTDVTDVSKGNECGMLISPEILIQEGDVLDVYNEEKIKQIIP